jgi:hypothetical protein
VLGSLEEIAGTVTDSRRKILFKPPSKLPYVIEISSIFISKQVNITTITKR